MDDNVRQRLGEPKASADNKSFWCRFGSHCWHNIRTEKIKVRQTGHDGFNKTYKVDKLFKECCHCHKVCSRFPFLWAGKTLAENGLEMVK